MKTFRTLMPVLLATTLGCAWPAAAQSGPADFCRAPDENAEALRVYAARLVTAEDGVYRETADDYGIPLLPGADATFVLEGSVCRRAAHRYAQELGDKGKPERTVYLIRLGTERQDVRYIAWDPEFAAGEYLIAMVLDHNLQVLASFTH